MYWREAALLPPSLRGGALLGDAVDVARVEQDLARLHAHHLDKGGSRVATTLQGFKG